MTSLEAMSGEPCVHALAPAPARLMLGLSPWLPASHPARPLHQARTGHGELVGGGHGCEPERAEETRGANLQRQLGVALTEQLQYPGQWWIGEPVVGDERKVPGTLNIEPNGRMELRLIGALREMHQEGVHEPFDGGVKISFTEDSLDAGGECDRIYGASGAVGFTLEECTRIQAKGRH